MIVDPHGNLAPPETNERVHVTEASSIEHVEEDKSETARFQLAPPKLLILTRAPN